MSEPRIFTSKDKGGEYTVLMAENGAPPEKIAKFRSAKVAGAYSKLFDDIYEVAERLTGRAAPVTEEEQARIGYEMFTWCDAMAGGE
jgi:hypothetical protein